MLVTTWGSNSCLQTLERLNDVHEGGLVKCDAMLYNTSIGSDGKVDFVRYKSRKCFSIYESEAHIIRF